MKLDNVISTRAHKKIYRDGDYCIKVFDSGFSKADVLNEALNLARIEETGLNTPKIHEVTCIDGNWAIVCDYIEGKTLEQLIQENPAKFDEYLELFVDLQLEVHAKKCPLLEGMPKHKKVCHGDFTPGNIIIANDGTPYILDWSHATQGNASADVARTYLRYCLSGKEDIAKKYLDLFCKKSDTAKQYVQKWMPIVAASQSVKGNEHEREFLLSWVDVVDYE